MRAVLYGRVSADRPESKSVDDQLSECRGWVAREGWSVVAEQRDDGVSASRYARRTARRDGWQQVMELITSAQVDVLVVWELSRASRDRAVWAALLAACQEHDVRLMAGGRLHDLEDPDDSFVVDLGAALAGREAALTSKRIRRAVRSRAAEGAPHGKLPYGYRSERDPETGRALRRVPHEETAPIVREIVRRLLAGEPLYSVAADLNERGVPGPRAPRWDPSTMKRLAISPTYAALRTHKGVVVGPAQWEALVSMADHQTLVARLTDPTRRTWVDGSVKHLLVGIAKCGECGATTRRIKNRNTPSYVCAAKFCVARTQVRVDELVERVIVGRLSRPDAAALFTSVDDPAVADAVVQAQELRARLDALYAEAAEGALSATGLARVEARLLPMIEAAERKARPRVLPTAVAELAGPRAADAWMALTMPQRREVVRLLLDVTILRVGGRAYARFDPESVRITWRS